jgi:hypothetical protein
MFATVARIFLAALAVLLLGIAAAMLGMGRPGFVGPLIWGTLLLIGVAFERWRYKRVEGAAAPGFSPTPERFLDPTSGEPVRVWANAAGERRYVRDPKA